MPFTKSKNHIILIKKNLMPEESATLHHLAFENSLQPNIISVPASGKIIIANNAALKLFGYSKKEFLTKSRADIFDIKEKNFKKMLRQRAIEGQAATFATAIKKSGKPIPCEITSAIFVDTDGIKKAITTITDISKIILEQKKLDIIKEKIVTRNIKKALIKSDIRRAENDEWIKYIAKKSYDVMWDYDIITGKIYVGESITEVFGYKVKANTVKLTYFAHCLLPHQKDTVEKKLLKALASNSKSWHDAFSFKRYNGTIASTISRASIIRDENGKAIRLIGAIQDITRLRELENQIAALKAAVKKEKIKANNIVRSHLKSDLKFEKNKEEQNEKYLLATRLSFDGIWDWNLLTNEFFLGEGFEKMFDHDAANKNSNLATDWFNYLHPDDKAVVEKSIKKAIASTALNWQHAYRFIRADGSVANVFGRASIIRLANGKASRIIGVIHDLSRQKDLEGRLKQEIDLKEKQIAQAMEEAKETERSAIGKELHDNINQLLGVSKLYLEMAKRGGQESGIYLNRSSEYTLTAIEEIRKLTKTLTTDIIINVGLTEAIENICRDTMEANPLKILCITKTFEEGCVNNKFKLNVFRIVQEQLNNILKHSKAKEAVINLLQNKTFIMLTISDNGIGFDISKKHDGIGLANIKSRAEAYNGTADFISKPGEGCVLKVQFPFTDACTKK